LRGKSLSGEIPSDMNRFMHYRIQPPSSHQRGRTE
jgi:hypothetical protein